LLNIQTKELQPHTPEYLSIVQMPSEYKPDTKCPKILEFFKEVLRPDEVDVMFRLFGYSLHKNCEYEKAAMLYGTGANGKGVVIRIIERFLGEDNCSHRSLQHLDTNRFAVADVCGKLVNTFADLKSVKLSETGNFKMLVSGDSISGEHKFENSFKFRNFAKLIFSANEIPESGDKSDAFYRRWLIFHFDKKFVGGKEDTKLLDKLTTPEELGGLLNMALTGLKQLIDDGGFHEKDIEDIRRDYEEHTNDVNTFLYRECLVDITNPEYSTLATDVYAAYVTFCVNRGSRPKEMSVFGKKLADQGIYNMRHHDHGDRDRYYDGIRLLTDMRGLNQTTID
jgi:putative DNA primase/helicase